MRLFEKRRKSSLKCNNLSRRGLGTHKINVFTKNLATSLEDDYNGRIGYWATTLTAQYRPGKSRPFPSRKAFMNKRRSNKSKGYPQVVAIFKYWMKMFSSSSANKNGLPYCFCETFWFNNFLIVDFDTETSQRLALWWASFSLHRSRSSLNWPGDMKNAMNFSPPTIIESSPVFPDH